jgi:hypothetical protein
MLRQRHSEPVIVIGDRGVPCGANGGLAGRWAKTNLDLLSPYRLTCYLDADTRPYGNLSVGFKMLEAGWELVIVPCAKQGADGLWHLTEEERAVTLAETGQPLMVNSGVMWFRKCGRISRLFRTWREEWLRFRDRDQGALLRALEQRPVKMWLLGHPFNGGSVVAHHFGQAAE